MSGEDSALIELGQVGAPFGVRGWVKLRSYTEPPERLLEHRTLRLRAGQRLARLCGGGHGSQRGCADGQAGRGRRSDRGRGAEGCGGRRAADASCRHAPAGDFYRADLLGCEVVNLAGDRLGVVAHFVETPAHALMVVRGDAGVLGAGRAAALAPRGLGARRVVVDWEEPSLAAPISGK